MAIHEHMPRRGILKGAVRTPVAACAFPALAFTDQNRLHGFREHVRRGRMAWPAASGTHGKGSSESASWAVCLHAERVTKAPVASPPEGSAMQVKYMKESYEPDLVKTSEPSGVNGVPLARLNSLATGRRGMAR